MRISKKTILICILLLIVISIIVVYQLTKVDFLTGEANNVKKVIITMEPDTKPRTIIIDDEDKILKIYDLIKQTKNISVKKYPSHSESIQTDSRFQIEIIYDDKSDLISSTENYQRIYRQLDSKGSSGDYGHISGENVYIWDYLRQLETSDMLVTP